MAPTTVHIPRICTRAELLGAGRSSEAITHALRDGRLYEVHRGVYAVGHPRLTQEERWLAAVLACGDGAHLSHTSAAALWGLLDEWTTAAPHVTIPKRRRARRSGIVVHRTSHLAPADTESLRGIPITSLRRTFIDLAATETHRTLRRALRQAEYKNWIHLPRLRHSLDDAVHPPGTHRLKKTLDRYIAAGHITESDAEDLFLALCYKHRLPTPEAQYRLGPYRYDFAWPRERIVVEIDEYDGHNQRIPFAEDKAKDRYAIDRNHLPLRVADFELEQRPTEIAGSLRAALAERDVS